jgi:phosphate transport system protein
MARESYQQSLADLRADVVAMGELVVDRLEMTLRSLQEGDDTLASEVIERDSKVNETYLELEGRCIDLFTLQQPVASDLRFVAASFKILTDIERIGDLATNLAGYSLAGDAALAPDVAIQTIGADAVEMVSDSLEAYAVGDPAACQEIAERDDQLDALCQQASETVARDLIEREAVESDPWAVEQLLDDVSSILLTVRDLERVGDHAVNIAARTLYMTESDPALIY